MCISMPKIPWLSRSATIARGYSGICLVLFGAYIAAVTRHDVRIRIIFVFAQPTALPAQLILNERVGVAAHTRLVVQGLEHPPLPAKPCVH